MFTAKQNDPDPYSNKQKRTPIRRFVSLTFSLFLGPGLLLTLSFLIIHPVRAAILVVTNTNDSGAGSLRQAILDANGSSGPDEITFNLGGCPCAIPLSSRLDINDALTITGPGASQLALDGGNAVQVIGTANVPVSISGLAISNGLAITPTTTGGGIYAQGPLTLTQMLIEGNTATDYGGGVLALNRLSIAQSIFENNTAIRYDGGGLYVNNSLDIVGSQFSNNRTTVHKGYGGGGGLISFGPTTITSSSFISNTSADWGGGAYLASFAPNTEVQLTSVQFNNNRAEDGGGGGLFSWFTTTLVTVDFSDNYSQYRGGGAYAGYAGNYGIQVSGGQMLRNSATGGGGLYSDSNFSLDGTQVLSNTARSGNGGGTWTPLNATISNATIAHNTVITNGNSGGVDTGANLILNNSIVFDNYTPNNGGGSGVGGTATVTNSQYFGNTAGGLGGAISAINSAIINSSQIEDNQALYNWGGGVFAGQTAVVTDTNFLRNSSSYAGGGLAVQFGAAQVTGGRFEGNSTDFEGWGGAIYAGGPSLIIRGTGFYSNTSQFNGGAIASNYVTAIQAIFRGNVTGISGGAIYASNQLNLDRAQIIANQGGAGGGVYLTTGDGTIVNTLFARNHSVSLTGDALYLHPTGTLSIQYTTISTPTQASGSAIYVNSGIVEVKDSIITNHAVGILQTAGSVNADYNLFHGNVLDTQGGGISNNHPIPGAPVFISPLQNNYHLGGSSAALDAGVDIGVYIDFDGNVRPQGAGFDVGYDEAGGAILFMPLVQR